MLLQWNPIEGAYEISFFVLATRSFSRIWSADDENLPDAEEL